MIVVLQRWVYLFILVTCLLTAEGLQDCTKYQECVHRVPGCTGDYYSCLKKSCTCTHKKKCILAGEVYECLSMGTETKVTNLDGMIT